MLLYMRVCICTQIYIRRYITGLRSIYYFLCAIFLVLLSVCLSIISLALNLPTKARLVASELQESASLHLPIAGILSICRMPVFFMCSLRLGLGPHACKVRTLSADPSLLHSLYISKGVKVGPTLSLRLLSQPLPSSVFFLSTILTFFLMLLLAFHGMLQFRVLVLLYPSPHLKLLQNLGSAS